MKVPNAIVFDNETEYADSPYDAPITGIGAITTEDGKYHFFDQDHVSDAIDFLLTADRLVSFHGRGFDIPTLLKYVDRGRGRQLRNMMHYDLYYEFREQYPTQRNSLENFSRATLKMGKLDILSTTPDLWKAYYEKFKEYNKRDCQLTFMLYIHVCQHGYVWMKYPTYIKFYPKTISRVVNYD